MQYRTHLATSLAVAVPIMAQTGTLGIGNIVAVGIGSLFPDIDEPHSWIGCRTRGLSDIINMIFGHRGLTHSLMGLIITFMTIVLLSTLTPFPALLGLYFLAGYTLHLIEDSFSKSGIKWLLPLSNHKFQSGMNVFYYSTGSLIENIILLISIGILVVQINNLDFSTINFPDISIFESLQIIIDKSIALIKK